VGEAEIVNDDGKLVAKCLSSMMVIDGGMTGT
jgi:acyl-coenzyme A thioesterase PaaI-like protein